VPDPASARTTVRSSSPEGAGNEWVAKLPLPNGLTFHLPSDAARGAAEFVIHEIFRRKRYAHPGFEIRPDDTIVDVGANMGLFVLWAAPQAPKGRVVAVEPTSVIDCLRMNCRLNCLDNVTSVKTALGRSEGTMEFVEYPGFNIVTHQAGAGPVWFTRFVIRLLYGRYRRDPINVTVPCAPLAKILDEHRLDVVNLLKMDCEGGEYEIFRGMQPEHWRRIERVALEFHELRQDQRHGELVERLESAGFKVEVRKTLLDYYFMHFGEIWAWR
jgi:FkbM family methyltransferase